MTSLGGSAVDKIIVNGEYNSALNDYDLAMIRLKKPLTLGGRLVCIHSYSNKHEICDSDFKYLLSTGSDILVN